LLRHLGVASHGLTGHLLGLVHAGLLHLGCRGVHGVSGPVGVSLEGESLLRVELDSPLSVHSEANAAGKSGHVSLTSGDQIGVHGLSELFLLLLADAPGANTNHTGVLLHLGLLLRRGHLLGNLTGHLLRLVHGGVLHRNLSHVRILLLHRHGRDLSLGHGVSAGKDERESLHGGASALGGDLAHNSDDSLVSSDVDHINFIIGSVDACSTEHV